VQVVRDFPDPTGKAALRVIDRVDFAVEPGCFIAIVGPSGCGKSTPPPDGGGAACTDFAKQSPQALLTSVEAMKEAIAHKGEFGPQQIDAVLRFTAETDPEVAERLRPRMADGDFWINTIATAAIKARCASRRVPAPWRRAHEGRMQLCPRVSNAQALTYFFRTEAPMVYFGSTMFPRRTRPA
jgi:hypothetical protein